MSDQKYSGYKGAYVYYFAITIGEDFIIQCVFDNDIMLAYNLYFCNLYSFSIVLKRISILFFITTFC